MLNLSKALVCVLLKSRHLKAVDFKLFRCQRVWNLLSHVHFNGARAFVRLFSMIGAA